MYVKTETFTVNHGGRYVNAPVCPQALYYAMGPYGLGVIDLDGNGFTTNDPSFSKVALVTSQKFYSPLRQCGLWARQRLQLRGQSHGRRALRRLRKQHAHARGQ